MRRDLDGLGNDDGLRLYRSNRNVDSNGQVDEHFHAGQKPGCISGEKEKKEGFSREESALERVMQLQKRSISRGKSTRRGASVDSDERGRGPQPGGSVRSRNSSTKVQKDTALLAPDGLEFAQNPRDAVLAGGATLRVGIQRE